MSAVIPCEEGFIRGTDLVGLLASPGGRGLMPLFLDAGTRGYDVPGEEPAELPPALAAETNASKAVSFLVPEEDFGVAVCITKE